MEPLLIEGMYGLGDNIFQRAVLQNAAREVYLRTPWPQLFADLPHVKCVKAQTTLRTQAKNVERPWNWSTLPGDTFVERRSWHYARRHGTILHALFDDMGIAQPEAVKFTGPKFEPLDREPYVIVRPATVRREWRSDSRNPLPEYLFSATKHVRRRFKIISIADLLDREEWLIGNPPVADETYHAGELTIEQLLQLVAGAAGLIGGVGWMAVAAVMYQRPMMLVHGGWGLHNGPQRIFDPRLNTSLIQNAMPDKFCMCDTSQHQCNKTITGFNHHVEEFLLRLDSFNRTAMVS